MIRLLRRPTAATLLLLFGALWLAPVGAVCSHGAADSAAVSPAHEHAAGSHASHGSAPTPTPAPDPPSCPMEQGQANCAAQAPLPSSVIAHVTTPLPNALQYDAAALTPPQITNTSIFRPPKA